MLKASPRHVLGGEVAPPGRQKLVELGRGRIIRGDRGSLDHRSLPRAGWSRRLTGICD
jgi:hypothetical protein